MKRLIGLFIVLAVSSVAWTDAYAATLLNATVVCDSDNDGTFGSPTDAKGKVVMTSNGTFKLTLSGLSAGIQAECSLHCVFTGTAVGPFPCGTPNASGKISFTLKEAFDPTAFCPAPYVAVSFFPITGGHCISGWGTGTPNPSATTIP